MHIDPSRSLAVSHDENVNRSPGRGEINWTDNSLPHIPPVLDLSTNKVKICGSLKPFEANNSHNIGYIKSNTPRPNDMIPSTMSSIVIY